MGYIYDIYDAYDQPVAMTDGIGAWAFGYDNNSQLTSVDGPWDNDMVTYVPDDLGRMSQMIAQGGTTVNYVYDPLNRLTEIQRSTDSFVYTYSGVNPLVQQLTRPNGSTTEYEYNALNQLTSIVNLQHTDMGDMPLSQHTFTYNVHDLRASETLSGPAIPPAPVVPETSTTYTTNAVNQLVSTTGPDRTFVYDDDGNMTQGYTKEGYVFTAVYDAENRMTSIQYTDSSSVVHRQEFRYSGDDLQAEQKVYENGTLVDTVRIVRDGMLAIQDRNAGNTVVNEYTWGLNLGGGIGGLLNLKTAGQNYAYLYDGKGNVEAVLDSAQAVVAAYRYDPFGVLLAKTGSFEQPFGFSTKRYDARTGLVFYEYRPYDPPRARWLTRDPLGEAGGMNLYAFVGNNPVNWVDPWGLLYAEQYAVGGAAIGGSLVAGASLAADVATGGLNILATPTEIAGGMAIGGIIGGGIGTLLDKVCGTGTVPVPAMPMARKRGKSDPVNFPQVNVGRRPDGRCNPCPLPIYWTHDHNGDGNFHQHGIEWNQTPDCVCHPVRVH